MQSLRRLPQIVLGLALGYAGVGHLGADRVKFRAQVPSLFEEYADFVVVASGVVEIILGAALMLAWHYRVVLGWIVKRLQSW